MSEKNKDIIIDHSVSHPPAVLHAMRGLLERGVLTDCHLVVKEQRIPCHRLVLAVCSPVLQAMLTCGLTETQTCTIPIELFGTEAIEAVVRYVSAFEVICILEINICRTLQFSNITVCTSNIQPEINCHITLL